MTARIYRPAKTAMQSGRGRTHEWVLEYEPTAPKRPDPLMGWAGSNDTQSQLKLHFASAEEAVAYCDARAIAYVVDAPQERTLRPKAYADNFRYDRTR